MARDTEPWGATTAAIVAGVSVFLVDKVLLLDKLMEHTPFLPRAFFVFLVICTAFLGRHYYLILGGADEPRGTEKRRRYDALRQNLSEGGAPAIVYNKWLKIGLGKVDVFFGDAGRMDRSWIARVLHLETDGPRWTAPAFDRCLQLALFYPILAVFAVWALSGHVGPAERAVQLPPDETVVWYSSLRGIAFFSVLACAYAVKRLARAEGLLPSLFWLTLWFGVTLVVSSSVPSSLSDLVREYEGGFRIF